MKPIITKLRLLALAAIGGLLALPASSHAAADPQYDTNDLMLFFQNPTGTTGSDTLVLYSLGSTWSVFRSAATPGDPTFGGTISLGNINTLLTSTYGATWNATTSIFAGGAGQNGSTNAIATSVSNGDYARTVYVTKPRAGAGTVGSANSATAAYNPANTGTASAISGSNNVMTGQSNPYAVLNTATTVDDQNPFSPTPTTPGTAYTSIIGGVQGALLSGGSYSLGSVSNVVLGLDLYRITPSLNGASAWQNVNSISGVTAGQGYYLGTITLSDNGDVNFVAIPEPSTASLLALAGISAWVAARRRKLLKS